MQFPRFEEIAPIQKVKFTKLVLFCSFKVVMVLCRLRPQSQAYTDSKGTGQAGVGPQGPNQPIPLLGMIAMAIALPPPTVHEVRLEPDMFVTRLAFDFRIIHCEPR